ncbi:methionine--tRNA ligase [Candidatus Dojkabacteria bacterium]|nr:methionine--tRNA ligase [Candidatus Dojkabacteria bacterium]
MINIMKMSQKFYLTTTLPYVNAIPHVGHTLEFVQADVIARYMRQKLGNDNVYFNVGTDEHGLKIFRKAKKEGLEIQDYVDKYAEKWKEFCELLQISYDRFIRTTDTDHIKSATEFWETCDEAGDIYKKKYEGLYCVGCEEFKTEKDLVDGKCPAHQKEPEKYSEENYFFKFSKYQNKLLELYKKNANFVKPKSKLKEMTSFVSSGLEDFSISRRKENLPWGVPVPGDDEQVMYVWFDALVNYITTIGYGSNEEKFEKWWPCVQLCGPDNTRFQSAMWQAMLMSAGIEPSDQILVHGMILAEDGTKMSKTIGNVVSPFDLIERYGVDAVRYYLVAGIPTFSDVAFSYKQLESEYRGDLQNNFGNLLNRIITLIKKREVEIDESRVDSNFKKKVDEYVENYTEFMDQFVLYDAMKKVEELGTYGNRYIAEEEPWAKNIRHEEAEEVLNNLHYLVRRMIVCYSPVLPEKCKKAEQALKNLENVILFEKI